MEKFLGNEEKGGGEVPGHREPSPILAHKVGYHDIERGMVFREVTPKKARTVTVSDTGIYHAYVVWTSARGIRRGMQVYNKHLSDLTRWELISRPAKAEGR